jgi:uncharacterized membrane protein YoaK (UPF0700 family)
VSDWRWGTAVQVLSLLMAAFFFAAAILTAVLQFELTGHPPPEPPDFLDGIIAFFRWDSARWPIDFAGTLLAALGFVAFGAVGVLLSRLAKTSDARRTVVATLMVMGATLGVVSQLLWIGVKPVATSPQFCECGLRAEEIMSRLMILNVAGGVQAWLNNGAIVLLSAGVLIATAVVRRAGASNGWVWLSYLLVIGALITPILGELHAEPYDLYSFFALVAVLVPGWALWLAIQAPGLATPDGPDEPMGPPPAEAAPVGG